MRIPETYELGQYDLTDPSVPAPPDLAPSPTYAQPAPAPMTEYVHSYQRAQAELDYLSAADATNWMTRINDAISLIPNELKTIDIFITGKTGDPEVENQLKQLWGTVHAKAIDMLNNQPTVIQQLAANATLALTDFWSGATQAMQDYTAWMIEHAGPALKAYWEGVNYLADLEQNLAQFQAAGTASPQMIADQQSKVNSAKTALGNIKSAVKTASGLDLDQLATSEYGPFTGTLSFALPVVAAIAVGVVAVVILAVVASIKGIGMLVDTGKGVVQQAEKTALQKVQDIADQYLPWVIGGAVLLVGGIIVLVYKYKMASRAAAT